MFSSLFTPVVEETHSRGRLTDVTASMLSRNRDTGFTETGTASVNAVFNTMKFILGTKVNMTEVFGEDGVVHPVTVISAPPVVVTHVRTPEKDGYTAFQVGAGTQKEKNIPKPEKGHLKGLGNFRLLKEFRIFAGDKPASNYVVGDKVDVTVFKEGDPITVSAISKGKGFQGVVKRHGFGGGRRTHGQKHSEREPGAIGGAGRAGGRVAKGMRMAGRMGGDKVTVGGLRIVQVNAETNTILVSGAVPGKRGTIVEIRG